MMKLYLDPGHGGKDPGAQGNGLKEKDITLDIAKRIRDKLLKDYEGVQIRMSRTKDTTKSLNERTKEANAWGADFYLSIHCNAFNGKASGYEDYIYTGLSRNSRTANYQDILHREITKVNGLRDRGKKSANFHVLRETRMPAFLSENGFIDNSEDAKKMEQSSWRQKVAEGHAKGLAKAFNLKGKKSAAKAEKKNEPNSKRTLYKVIAGSFSAKKNADNQVKKLKAKGIEAFVDTVTISGKRWYRVQAGAFQNRGNAEKHVANLKKKGFQSFITT